MKKNIEKYTTLIVILPIFFIIVATILLGGYSLYSMDKHNKHDIQNIKSKFLKSQKEILKTNVQIVNTRINVFNHVIYKQMKERLKLKVNTGATILKSLYNKYKDTKSKEDIQEMMFEALSHIQWRDGKNYFWVMDLDGVEHIAPSSYKNNIGKNILNKYIDLNGIDVVENEINLIKTKKEGYLYNSFIATNGDGKQHEQISYIKKLNFYNWYIGTAEFISDNINDAKYNIITRFSQLDYSGNDYIFILDLLDINGGDKFAKMLLNKNRPDLIGKYLNDSYKDAKGKEFRKEFLSKIRNTGEAWVEYYYKKPDGTISKKISYFYLNKTFNWIIANGFYFDDLEVLIKNKTIKKNQELKSEMMQIIVIALLTILILTIMSNILSKNIKKSFDDYADKLEHINKNLAKTITHEIEKNSKKDLMIFKQARLATLGEMIGNIAHQWRQPLNAVGATMMKLELINDIKYKSSDIQNIVDDTNVSLKYMSKTIDDFRDLFTNNKETDDFYIHEIINEALSIIKVQLDEADIKLLIDDRDGKIQIHGNRSELLQVLLNIINNAKDAIMQKKRYHPKYEAKIIIMIEDLNKDVVLSIIDNAGGINKEIIDKIFEPYFTTKFKSKGTGIGLYMSKMIVERGLNGTLTAANYKDGAMFQIVLHGGG